MLRLRTTVTLSALLLVLGVAGTGWLSTLTASGYAPSPRLVASGTTARTTRPHSGHRQTAHVGRVGQHAGPTQRPRVWHTPAAIDTSADQLMATAAPELVPLSMPSDDSLTWEQLRGHLHGQVLLRVSVDGNGQVRSASVAQSSGDELLDTYALRSVRRWRFAVPEGSSAGSSGEVTVRYASSTEAQ